MPISLIGPRCGASCSIFVDGESRTRNPLIGIGLIDPVGRAPQPAVCYFSGSAAIAGFCPHGTRRAALPQRALQEGPEAADGRLVHTPEVREQGLPALCPALRLLHCDPFRRPLFSIASLPSATSPMLWSGRTPIRGAASCGCPSFAAPTGDPVAADGPLKFRYAPFGRDLALAPGGASVLSPDENRRAARWCERQLGLRNKPISGVNPTPHPTATHASDAPLP
jgi:hypothetical protein